MPKPTIMLINFTSLDCDNYPLVQLEHFVQGKVEVPRVWVHVVPEDFRNQGFELSVAIGVGMPTVVTDFYNQDLGFMPREK
jgi:hypothetical protein